MALAERLRRIRRAAHLDSGRIRSILLVRAWKCQKLIEKKNHPNGLFDRQGTRASKSLISSLRIFHSMREPFSRIRPTGIKWGTDRGIRRRWRGGCGTRPPAPSPRRPGSTSPRSPAPAPEGKTLCSIDHISFNSSSVQGALQRVHFTECRLPVRAAWAKKGFGHRKLVLQTNYGTNGCSMFSHSTNFIFIT